MKFLDIISEFEKALFSWRMSFRGGRAEGKHLDVKKKPRRVKFSDLCEKYQEYSKTNKKSWESDITVMKKLKNFLGDIHLDEITPWLVEKYKSERRKIVAPATVNRALACLKHMFTKAIDWGDSTVNPVKKVKLFKEPPARVRFLEGDEIQRLLSECHSTLRPLVVCALHSGMRKGEIFSLTWDCLDFKQTQIVVRESKNGESRYIPMSKTLEEILMKQKEQSTSQFVFPGRYGKKLVDIKTGFRAALERAGIKDFRFHDLRHTFASQLVMNGETLNTVRELLGHKTLEMTLRYSHLSKSHKSKAVKVMDGIMGKEENGTNLAQLVNK